MKSQRTKFNLKSSLDNYPVYYCLFLTIFFIISCFLSFVTKNSIYLMIGLLPVSLYEIYRTYGIFTKLASILLLFILILEIYIISANVNIDLLKLFFKKEIFLAGINIKFGELRYIFSEIIILLALILLVRTIGIYTKWLSIILIIGCLMIIYIETNGKIYHYFNMIFKYLSKILYY